MRHNPSVSLVVPMFNEEENIEHALACAVEALERHSPGDYEIVVVDDASQDRSAEIVARESAARTSSSTWTPTSPSIRR
jgi:glycosyltransferase involved in cell wall biosynthesis